MSEILPGLHQVEGVDPSPAFSTHVFLLRDGAPGSTWTLIDSGLPGSEKGIARYLADQHIDPTSVRTILLTHLHLDHVGALKPVVALTGATTYAHWIDAAFIEKHPLYDGPGRPPAEPFSVHHRIKDGDAIPGGGGLVAYHTPGHTPGHTAYYHPGRKLLFSGDLFFGMGTSIGLTTPEYTHHTPTAQISARRVAELEVDALLTYHGGPYISGGGRLVRELVKGW